MAYVIRHNFFHRRPYDRWSIPPFTLGAIVGVIVLLSSIALGHYMEPPSESWLERDPRPVKLNPIRSELANYLSYRLHYSKESAADLAERGRLIAGKTNRAVIRCDEVLNDGYLYYMDFNMVKRDNRWIVAYVTVRADAH